jgi:hypothetical protein
MRKSKFSPTQIAKILKEFDLGKDLETKEDTTLYCRTYGKSVTKITGFF